MFFDTKCIHPQVSLGVLKQKTDLASPTSQGEQHWRQSSSFAFCGKLCLLKENETYLWYRYYHRLWLMNVKSTRYRHQEYNQNYVFICKLNIFVSDWFFTGKLQSKYLENYLSRNWNNLTLLHRDALTIAVWIKSSTFALTCTFYFSLDVLK